MAKHKKSLQTLILSLMLANLFLAFNAKTVHAQTSSTSTQKYRGVDEQIKAFLCTPSNASTDPEAAKGDLYNCINKLYRFALIIVSIFGVLMIILGGWVYMAAAGNEEAVTKAKDILTTTIVAIIIIFSGYVLLRFLNPDLIKFQPIQPPSVVGKERAYSFQKVSDAEIKAFFGQYGVTVEPGKTLTGLSQAVQNEIANLKKDCNQCNVVITSSTEGAHAADECSHASGDKADLQMGANLTNYIQTKFQPIADRNDSLGKVKQWKNSASGAIYAKEDFKSTPNWTGTHWDVAVCGGGG